MKGLKIRKARKEDAMAIDKMVFDWLKWERKRVETILEILEDINHVILAAELNGQIVGVLHMLFYLDILHGTLNCHVNLLLVKQGYRGKGIGKELLDKAVKQAKKRGAIEMHVDTVFSDAARFYRRYGFKDDGVWLELSLKKVDERS